MTKSRKKRIYYVGMVATQGYIHSINESSFVGAASGKMTSIVSALRLAGRNAVLISLPFVKSGAFFQGAVLCRTDGFPALFLPVSTSSLIRKIVGIFSFALFSLRCIKSQDTVVFYNHAIEYILALFILRIRGVAVFQDIEDLPVESEKGLRRILNRFGYWLMFKLSSCRKITVSRQMGENLNLDEYLAVQGIALRSCEAEEIWKWTELEAGGTLRIHYGGSLVANTGLNLFCEAVHRLESVSQMLERRVEFVITGVGDFDILHKMAIKLKSNYIGINVYEEVSRPLYRKLLVGCHVSLSLKNPLSDLSDTTFPSKVLEITSYGLALVSTRVSDVDSIFTESSVWFLSNYKSEDLVGIILAMAKSPSEVRRRANIGQRITLTHFDPLRVGQSLAGFLEKGMNKN
ncbi:MAG: hypothetical protein ACT4NK_06365 [Limnobacter sp.]|uniref:hypothetical protein n=1 Tax=Limnobacter sp. TaxID=2003368 RepID=UPI004037D07A